MSSDDLRKDPDRLVGGTRRRILDRLKRADGLSAAELARMLGITEAAVRQHLDGLAARGLVDRAHRPPGGRGRPAAEWRVSDLGRDLFPDHHADLTVELIRAVRAAAGDDGLERVIAARTDAQETAYRAEVGAGPVRERVERLARIRSAEGYLAEVRDDGDDLLLVEHHCPICDAASACQSLCRGELELFERVLGDQASVVREQHLLNGAERCVYRIRSRA
jgi:predicted ArsR family transcriptional regulator